MEANIEEARTEDINDLQNQITGQNYQRFMNPTSDTFMPQSVCQDISGSGNSHDSFHCVDMCPDVRYVNEHLVTTNGMCRTSQYIDPMCDVLMSQSAYQDHTGLAKSQVSFDGVDYYPDINTPDEPMVFTKDFHMNPQFIEPVCDVFMSQNIYQDNHRPDNSPDLQYLDKHLVNRKKQKPLNLPRYRWDECHECPRCIEGFTHEHELTAHMMMTHAEENPLRPTYFETEEYSLNFQEVISIEEPVVPHTDKKPHKCSVCGVGFRQLSVLQQHIMFLHNADIPNIALQYSNDLHIKAAKQRCLENSDCGRKFNKRKHLKTHTKKKPYQCSVCHQEFRYSYLWTNHILTHTGETPSKCLVCNKEFTSSSSLERHMVTHRGQPRHNKTKRWYVCSVCKKEFKRSSHLRRHVLNKHSVTAATEDLPKLVQYKWDECHDCSHCIEGFTNEYELTAHMVTHKVEHLQRPSDCRSAGHLSKSQETISTKECMKNTNKKPHECPVCGIRFRQLSVYQQHMLLHKTDILKVCPQYSNDLISPMVLREHQDIKVTKKKHLGCSHCSSKFSKQKHLKVHMKTHKGKRLYKCSSCSEEFSHLIDLRKHVSTHSGDKLYMCSLCNKRFKRSSSLKKHMVMQKDGKTYKCSVCRKEFRSSSRMKKHVIREHSVVQSKEPLKPQYRWDECHQCPQCITGFTHDHELTAHMATHKVKILPRPCLQKGLSTKKSLKCSHWSKEFSKSKHLKQHMLIHPGDRPYKCIVCNKGFIHSSSLDEHMMTHTEEKPHKCSVCSKRFRRSKSLRSHMKQHLIRSEIKEFYNMTSASVNAKGGTNSEEYKCQKCCQCGLLFSSISKLKKHKKTHKVRIDSFKGSGSKEGTNKNLQTRMQNVSPISSEYDREGTDKSTTTLKDHMMTHSELHKCPVCQIGFRILSELGSHMMLHTTGNPPKCCVCNRGFNHLANLRLHMRIHTGEKPDKCSVCKRCFRTPSNLREHMMIHTGDKPHKCSVCNKGFIRSVQLRRHIMKHTGHESHKHSVHSKMFVHSAELYSHTNTHTTPKQHNCTLCNRSFEKFSQFVYHMEMHTRKKRNETEKKIRKKSQEYNCDQCKKLFRTQSVFDRHTTKCTCTFCEQSFCKLSYLNNHMRTHKGENLNNSSDSFADTTEFVENKTCYICSTEFETVSAFNAHMRYHVRPKGYMCYVCGRSFRQLPACQKHMLCITRKRPFQCPFCNKKYLYLSAFKMHVSAHTDRTPHPCLQCVEMFSSMESLLAHKCYPEGNEYHCCHCRKSFTCLSSLKEHVSKIQTGTEIHVCFQCSRWFPRQDDLDKHKFSHTKWTCSDCAKRFSVRKYLEVHLYTHISNRTTKVHICSVCKKGFTALSDFKDHMHIVTHTHEDYTECVNCVRGFLQQADLESHLALHLDIVN